MQCSATRSTSLLVQRVRGWCWPLAPATVLVPAVVVVVAMTAPMVGWPDPLWGQTSAQIHQQFTWAGLVAGTSVCWCATRFHGRDRIWMQRHASWMGGPAVQRHLVLLVSWLVGVYLLALTPLVVSTVVAGGIGAPDPLVMLSGILAMVAAVALGCVVGTIVPSMVMVPITAAAFYALLVVGNVGGHSDAAVVPVLYLELELGRWESLPLLVFRIAVFVTVVMASVGIATRWLRGLVSGLPRPRRPVVALTVRVAVPVVLIAGAMINKPGLFAVYAHRAAACTVQRDIRYRVRLDQQSRLAALVDSVDPVIARYGTTPGVVTQVRDRSLAWGPIDADVARGLRLAWLNPDGTIQHDIPTVLAGLYSCALDPAAQGTTEDTTGDDARDGAGEGGAAEDLAGVTGDVLAFLEGETAVWCLRGNGHARGAAVARAPPAATAHLHAHDQGSPHP